MSDRSPRVTVVQTHPIQYLSPWYRYIHANRRDLELTVLYGGVPAPAAQGAGFGVPFQWDVELRGGYPAGVLNETPFTTPVNGDRFSHFDPPGLESALLASAPDAVLVPGWHTAMYRRAVKWCRSHGIPLIYRGDTNLLTAPGAWLRPLWRVHSRQRLHEYDAWLSVGRASRRYLETFHVPEPLTFDSPHAIDNAGFKAASAPYQAHEARARLRASWGLDPARFTVLLAGKLLPGKHPLDAVHAVARLSAHAQLLVAGAGPLEMACRREAERLGVRASFRGFMNQSEMPQAYAAADCLVVPSATESWGLVVNEAMACGRPAVVSDHVACAADLVTPDETGEIAHVNDVDGLAAALDRVRRRIAAGHDYTARCRARIASYDYPRAADGLVAACARLRRRDGARAAIATRSPRVVACCGGMVIAGGLERMTFEVLGALTARGAAALAIVNTWESSPIVGLAERVGASWSTGYYRQRLSRRLTPPVIARSLWEAARTSLGLLRDARGIQPTHILLPDFATALRNLPALWWLKRRGVTIVMRLGNAPTVDALHRRVWRRLIDPVVERYLPNSSFIAAELRKHDIDAAKIEVIYNAPWRQPQSIDAAEYDPTRVIYVGQVIPPKGVDVLLDAVALVAARGIPITLEIVGRIDGWESPSYAGYRRRIRERAERPDLAGRILLTGHQDDVMSRYARAAVHCCPSQPAQREGLAGVVLEAKSAGLPSVVTPTGSLPELVRHAVDGWVARDASAEAIAEGLVVFLQSQAVRHAAGVEARRSLELFSRERFERAWCRVFGIDASATSDARPMTERRAS